MCVTCACAGDAAKSAEIKGRVELVKQRWMSELSFHEMPANESVQVAPNLENDTLVEASEAFRHSHLAPFFRAAEIRAWNVLRTAWRGRQVRQAARAQEAAAEAEVVVVGEEEEVELE